MVSATVKICESTPVCPAVGSVCLKDVDVGRNARTKIIIVTVIANDNYSHSR